MTEGRDEKGRFIKGCAPGPGKWSRAEDKSYLDVMRGECSLDDWAAITRRAVSGAKHGDAKARQWLSDYLLGKPQEHVDVTSAGEGLRIVIGYADNSPDDTEAA